jgi:hypothetical protein
VVAQDGGGAARPPDRPDAVTCQGSHELTHGGPWRRCGGRGGCGGVEGRES